MLCLRGKLLLSLISQHRVTNGINVFLHFEVWHATLEIQHGV